VTRYLRAGLLGSLLLALCVVLPTSASVTAAATCDNAPVAGPTVKVLVIGDSLTNQFAGDYTWRYRFWQYERKNGVNIDFVGPVDTLLPVTESETSNDDYADPCFNQRDHDSVGGKDLATTLTITQRYCQPNQTWYDGTEVAWATSCYQPDVVLGFMGYNDLKPLNASSPAYQGHHGYTPAELLTNAQAFVTEVQTAKPGTAVAMATVLSTKAPQVVVNATAYNASLETAMAAMPQTNGPIGVVDPTVDWKGAADTWDGYHPTANGEMHLAWDISEGLSAVDPTIVDLRATGLPTPAIPPVEPIGPRLPGTVSVLGGTKDSVQLSLTLPDGANNAVPFERDMRTGTVTQLPSVDLGTAKTQTMTTTVLNLDPDQYQFWTEVGRGSAVATDITSAAVTVDLRPSIGVVGRPAASSSLHAVQVRWSAAATADRYLVRFRRPGSAWSSRSTTATSYRVEGLLAGATYQLQVIPVRSNIMGSPSAVITAVARGTVNPALPRPRVTRLTHHRIRVTWKRSAHATRYQVLIRTKGRSWHTLGWTTATTLTSRRLVARRHYAVAVVGWDSYVAGRRSAATAVTAR
jgi:hypothetical protein